MAYSAEISRVNPSCFVFVIDQSGSMADPFPAQPGKRKADGVSDALNRQLQELVLRCAKSEGVRDYLYVGVIGYGARVGPALGGVLTGKEIVSISEIVGMEDEVISMQEIYRFRRRGREKDGSIIGDFETTGVRPRFMELFTTRGITVPATQFAPGRRSI